MITSPATMPMPMLPSAPEYSASATIAPPIAKTSANAPIASAAARRTKSGRETCGVAALAPSEAASRLLASALLNAPQKRFNPSSDVVSDPADRIDVLAGRIIDLPVFVAFARIERAGVAAAHRD